MGLQESTNLASKNSNDTSLSLWNFPGFSDGNLPTMKETWAQSLGQKDLLEEEMATHSSTSASLVAQMVKNLPAMQETWV